MLTFSKNCLDKGGHFKKRLVPGDYLCVGKAIYAKDVQLDNLAGKRVFLCFDGIHYCGVVSLNKMHIGDMLPYVPYRFEITDSVKEGTNTVEAVIEDITAHYGPTGGWEDYGGISRDVYLEVCDSCEIIDWQWKTRLENDYRTAACMLNVWTDQPARTEASWSAEIRLSLAGGLIYSQIVKLKNGQDSACASFEFVVEHPMLWSCDIPALYDLEIIVTFADCQDAICAQVGFREFKVSGSRFLLNGKDTFLKGVARHEAWGTDQGFALTAEQIEQDLVMIKQMGGNYCRLVHYPHHRKTIEIADKIGLLVSEEPGLWWNDLSDPVITNKALEVMRRTVLRDRNSPSVVFWLLFNECHLKGGVEYLSKGKKMVLELDDTRPITAANAIEAKEAKDVFDQADMDFYTIHPYVYEPKALIDNLEILRGKPVVFTEWGGWLIHNNQNLIKTFKRVIACYSNNRDPEPNLAGMSWWQWQDVFQFSRGLPGCEDGLLSDGLVDRFRHRKPMLAIMAEFFDLTDKPFDPGYTIQDLPGLDVSASAAMLPIDLQPVIQIPEQSAAWAASLASCPHFEKTRLAQFVPSRWLNYLRHDGSNWPFFPLQTQACCISRKCA